VELPILSIAFLMIIVSVLAPKSCMSLFAAGWTAAVAFVAGVVERGYVDVMAGLSPIALVICVMVFLVLWLTPFADGQTRRRQREYEALRRFLLFPAVVLCFLIGGAVLEMGISQGEARSLSSNIHLLLLAAACASASCAAGAGCALGIQDLLLKYKRPLPISITLPSLSLSDAATYRLCGVAFGTLSLAMIVGWLEVGSTWGAWRWELRTVGALVLWAFYGAGLHLRRIAGWRGFRLAAVSTMGFVVLVMVAMARALWSV